MRLADTYLHKPGSCNGCGRSLTPVVDFERDTPGGFRMYLCERCLTAAGELVGLRTDAAIAVAVADVEQRAAEVAAKENALAEVLEDRDRLATELNAMTRSVGFTLQKGATVRGGKIALRLAPGIKKADLPRELQGDVDEAA